MSVISLMVAKAREDNLDRFLARYALPDEAERLVNDIAFLHCEEPLISPRVWLSLSDSARKQVALSLRHPAFRTPGPAPTVIKVTTSDLLHSRPPEVMSRILGRLGRAIPAQNMVFYSIA
jgi:hypothetical protein